MILSGADNILFARIQNGSCMALPSVHTLGRDGSNKARHQALHLDLAACWVNNPRGVINVHDAVWRRRFHWSNELLPAFHWDGTPLDQRLFWGVMKDQWRETIHSSVSGLYAPTIIPTIVPYAHTRTTC